MTTTELHVVRTPAVERRRPVEGPLRLTRRGRVVVVCAALLVLLGALVALGPSVLATADGDDRTRTVTVHPGETLWDIAGRVNPDGDVRDTVEDISELNGISDAGALQIGAELSVPRY